MTHYIDMFSPLTYEAFSASDRTISGFRERQRSTAQRIHPGDRFVCYMIKYSRWVGILEVPSECFIDATPRFYEKTDPFVVRFRVAPVVWLPRNQTIPIREPHVWETLTFTRGEEWSSARWKGMIRFSLRSLDPEDAAFLEDLIQSQAARPRAYPIDEDEWRSVLRATIRRPGGVVPVTVPEDAPADEEDEGARAPARKSLQVQAAIARIGETMGFSVWIPRADRGRILGLWTPSHDSLLDSLPLNYDDITLSTIEQIDVIWLKRRAIIRAFEVEHTTSVYSGLLRMADLLALQPNMDIQLHIVAPSERRDKVLQELQRPIFSSLERHPLAEVCSFIPYEGIDSIAGLEHLSKMRDEVLEDFAEYAEEV
jgi:hypothetical protein